MHLAITKGVEKKALQDQFAEYGQSLPQDRRKAYEDLIKMVDEGVIDYRYFANGKDRPIFYCLPCTYISRHFFFSFWSQPAPTSSFLIQQGQFFCR